MWDLRAAPWPMCVCQGPEAAADASEDGRATKRRRDGLAMFQSFDLNFGNAYSQSSPPKRIAVPGGKDSVPTSCSNGDVRTGTYRVTPVTIGIDPPPRYDPRTEPRVIRWLRGWRLQIVSPNAAPGPTVDEQENVARFNHADPVRSMRLSTSSGPPCSPASQVVSAFSRQSKRSDGTRAPN
jgi:hypothetical protein